MSYVTFWLYEVKITLYQISVYIKALSIILFQYSMLAMLFTDQKSIKQQIRDVNYKKSSEKYSEDMPGVPPQIPIHLLIKIWNLKRP